MRSGKWGFDVHFYVPQGTVNAGRMFAHGTKDFAYKQVEKMAAEKARKEHPRTYQMWIECTGCEGGSA